MPITKPGASASTKMRLQWALLPQRVSGFHALTRNRKGGLWVIWGWVAVVTVFSFGVASRAMAECRFYPGNTTQHHPVTMPAQLNVPRNVAAGTVLWTSPLVPAYRAPGFTGNFAFCTAPGTFYKNTIAPLGPALAGSQQFVAMSNLKGVGVRFFMRKNNQVSYNWAVMQSNNAAGSFSLGNFGWYQSGDTYWGAELIKTNEAVEAGVLNATDIYGRLFLENLHAVDLRIAGTSVVTGYTCTTPDVLVPLGPHHVGEFGGVGSKVGARDFVISVNACPSGLKSIKYRLNPVNGVLNASQAVAGLEPGSTSGTGFGVQITDRSNNPITFAIDRIVPGYAAGASGDFSIPLRGSYYKTSATVKPGAANTNVEFTMTYE